MNPAPPVINTCMSPPVGKKRLCVAQPLCSAIVEPARGTGPTAERPASAARRGFRAFCQNGHTGKLCASASASQSLPLGHVNFPYAVIEPPAAPDLEVLPPFRQPRAPDHQRGDLDGGALVAVQRHARRRQRDRDALVADQQGGEVAAQRVAVVRASLPAEVVRHVAQEALRLARLDRRLHGVDRRDDARARIVLAAPAEHRAKCRCQERFHSLVSHGGVCSNRVKRAFGRRKTATSGGTEGGRWKPTGSGSRATRRTYPRRSTSDSTSPSSRSSKARATASGPARRSPTW